MRRLFLAFSIFVLIPFESFSQKIDSVSIKGYYVTRFLKEEISFSYEQKIKKIRGESFSTPIDYTQISFFIPVCIDDSLIIENKDILKRVTTENNMNKDSLYYLPTSNRIKPYIKHLFNVEYDLSKEISILSEVGRLSPYYIDDESNKYLYKCFFINGCAIKRTIENIEKNRFPINLDIYSVNRESQFIDLFFITRINSYTSIVNIEGLREWFPYCDKE